MMHVCPNCEHQRNKGQMKGKGASARCVFCLEKKEPSFLSRLKDTLRDVREAGIECDVDEDQAYEAYERALLRAKKRYG